MTQKDLYNETARVGERAKLLTRFVQNDIMRMLEDKHINARDVSDMLIESRKGFNEVIDELQNLKLQTNIFFTSVLEKLQQPEPLDKDAIAKKLFDYLETQQVGNFIHVLKEAGVSEADAKRLCKKE